MASVTCSFCQWVITFGPVFPMEFVPHPKTGQRIVKPDFTPIYEHMRDQHGDNLYAWNDEVAQEFEDWKAGRLVNYE